MLLKKRVDGEHSVSMCRFLGLVGLLNAMLLWPPVVVLHISGVETWGWPSDPATAWLVVANAIIGAFL